MSEGPYPSIKGTKAQQAIALFEAHQRLTTRELAARWPGGPLPFTVAHTTIQRLKGRGILQTEGATRPNQAYQYSLKIDPRLPMAPRKDHRSRPWPGRDPITWLPLGRAWRPGDAAVFLERADWEWARVLRWRLAPDGGVEHDGAIAGIRLHMLIADPPPHHEVVARDGNLLNCCRCNLIRQRKRYSSV